jgi:bifunctional non-homologous end joining protein LigD
MCCHLDGYDIAPAPLLERKTLLGELLRRPPRHLAYSTHVLGHGAEAYAKAHENGLEGIISKRADAPYRAGRGDDWRKTKSLLSDEFAVVGYTAPKGSRSGFGSLLLARPEARGAWRYVGRVGTGFDQRTLASLARTLARLERAQPTAFGAELDAELRRAHWLEPALVAEVYYRGIGNRGLLRQPSLKALRPDKRAADLHDSDRVANKRSSRKRRPA